MSWNKKNCPKTLLEAVAAHSFFCTLGYRTEEIILCLDREAVSVRLQSGEMDFLLPIGKPELPVRKMKRAWLKLVEAWNSGGSLTHNDKNEICRSSKVFGRENEIIAEMVAGSIIQRRLKPPPDWWTQHSLN